MKVDLFDYNLPKEFIAQAPVRPRERAKMLVLDRQKDTIRDLHVSNLTEVLTPGDLLVFNVTKVRHARVFGRREMNGEIVPVELLVLKPLAEEGQFESLMRGKHIEIGQRITFDQNDINATIIDKLEDGMGRFVIEIENASTSQFLDYCEKAGQLPLPPYINNPQIAGFEDELYQPVVAKELGSVAAPTASLHFSDSLIRDLHMRGIKTAEVILHVGLGTFIPVRVEDTKDHVMHSETIQVTDELINKIRATKSSGGRVIAVGTTVARALESAYYFSHCEESAERMTKQFESRSDSCKILKDQIATTRHGGSRNDTFQLKPYSGETNLFITPGYQFKVIDGLLTNFHMPKSTLLMMVSAFISREKLFELYDHALISNYRFLSFGDCMFLL